jgi:hypothetical protein
LLPSANGASKRVICKSFSYMATHVHCDIK